MKFQKFSFSPKKIATYFSHQARHLRAAFRALPKKIKTWILTSATAVVGVVLVLVLVLLQARPDLSFAAGLYTTSATDSDGNSLLANNAVTDTAYYDTAQDSSPETQRQLGVDPNWTNGVTRKSSAIKLDGADDRIAFANTSGSILGATDATISLWIKPIAFPGGSNVAYLFSHPATADNNRAYIYLGGTSEIGVNGGSSGSVVTNSAVPGTWYHVVFVLDRTSQKYRAYINGVQALSNGYTPGVATTSINIGCLNSSTNSECANAYIDDVRVYKRVLAGSEISALYAHDPVSSNAQTLGLALDEGSGTAAYDTSSLGNDGALKNGYDDAATGGAANGTSAGPLWVSGANAVTDGFKGCGPEDSSSCQNPSGKSGAGNVSITSDSSTTSDNAYEVQVRNSPGLQFDGTDDIVTFADNNLADIRTGSMTWSLWFKTSTSGTLQYLYRKTNSSAINGIIIFISASNTLSASISDGSVVATIASGSTVTDGIWHLGTIVLDRIALSLSMYIDGASVASTTTNVPSAATDLNASSSFLLGGQSFFNGTMDDIRVWSRALPAADVANLYNARPVSNLSLAAWWKFDEGSGQTINDSSGNGISGSLGANSGSATDDPTWTEGARGGSPSSARTADSPAWIDGYQYREPLKTTNGASDIPAGYSLTSPVSRSSKLDALQTRADGKDWRVMYQPTDATRGLSFDGSNDGVTLSSNSSYADFGTGDFSFSLWVKLGSVPGAGVYPRILNKETGAAPRAGYYLLVNGDTGKFAFGTWEGGASSSVANSSNLVAGTWYHVVGTRSGTSLSLVVNGVLSQATTTLRNVSSSTNLLLGRAVSGAHANATVDDVRIWSMALPLGDAQALYNGGFGTPNSVGSNPIGWWRLDEGSGQIVLDASGNANHGYLGTTSGSESADPAWTTDGVVSTAHEVPRYIPQGNALKFDGSNDGISVPDNALLKPTTQVTVEAWFNTTSKTQGTQKILSKTETGGYVLGLNDLGPGQLTFSIYGGGAYRTAGVLTSTFNNNQWYHVAGTFDGSYVRLYLNGTLVASTAWSGSISYGMAVPLCIGNEPGSTGLCGDPSVNNNHPFIGQIAQPRVSNSVRYSSNFTPSTTPFAPDVTTVGLWRFSEGSGTSVADSSGNGNNGTLKNGSSNSPAADGSSAGPIWQANQSPVVSAATTYFTAQAPIAASATNTDYYLYYGNLNEGGTPSSAVLNKTGLQFDGVDDYAEVGSTSALDVTTGDLTISGWVYPTASTTSVIAAKKLSSSVVSAGYSIEWCDAGQRICIRHGDGTSATDLKSSILSLNQWHFFVATYTGSTQTASLYINGSGTPTTASYPGVGSLTTAVPFRIGKSNAVACANNCFAGQVDDIRVYNRVLSATEAVDLYSNAPAVSSSGLLGWWKLDEGSGTAASDSSGQGNTSTLSNFNFGVGSGWSLNENLLDLANAPTLTAALSSADVNEPWFVTYRAISNPTAPSGSWSAYFPMSSAPTQLGSTGVKVKFNLNGAYSRLDTFKIASWAVEAFSTSSPQRGARRSLPKETNIIANGGGVDIIDAQTNKLWMRIPTGSSSTNSLIYSGDDPFNVTVLNGRIYVGKNYNQNPSIEELQLDLDQVRDYRAGSGNRLYQGGIAQRAADAGFESASGTAPAAWAPGRGKQISVAVISGKQYLAVGGTTVGVTGGVTLLHDVTAISSGNRTTLSTRYARAASTNYSHVALSAAGYLYAANVTSGGLDRWDAVQSDTGDQTSSADRTYSTSSTPALRSNTVTTLSISEGASQADYSSPAVAVGTDLGVDLISEHSTQSSAVITRYAATGSTGTSGWNSKGFGGAAEFDGASDIVSVPTSTSLDPGTGDFTIEAWIRTSAACAAYCEVLRRRNAGPGYALYLNSSGRIYGSFTGSAEVAVASINPVNDGVWHHVAAVRTTQTTLSLYVDGQLQGSTTHANLSGSIGNSEGVVFGRGASYFNGLIDEARLSNVARYTAAFTPVSQEFTTDANTVGLWHLNETSGQVISDASVNANNGTLGAASTAGTDDPFLVSPALDGAAKVTAVGLTKSTDTGKGLSFDGGDFAQATVSALNSLGTGEVTVATWVKTATSAESTIIDNKSLGSNVAGISLSLAAVNGGRPSFRIANGSSQRILTAPSGSIINDNIWHQVVATRDNATGYLRLYIDGVQVNSTTQDTSWNISSAWSLCMGAMGTSGGCSTTYSAAQSLDDVRVYSRALGPVEVAQLYNGGRGPSNVSSDTGLLGNWKMNEGSGQIVRDYSSAANQATLGASSASSTDDPTWITNTPVREQPALWTGTNGASANDGAVTAVNLASNRRVLSFVSGSSVLPDNDITSLSMGGGGLALIGTEVGAWNPGQAGVPQFDPLALASNPTNNTRLKQDTRLKGGARLR